MTDIVNTEKRSQMMAGIRGKNTRGELIVRRGLHRMGFRFKLHDAKLPGKPDIVLPRYKAVILVNGCFWHGHGCHLFKWPSSRIDFWKAKITRNQQKDDETLVELKKLGWRVLIIWECATKGKTKVPLDIMLKLVAEWIVNGGQRFEVRGTDVN